jgi:alanyl-tRNA synthetase
MKKTEALFYQDIDRAEFEATVIEIREGKRGWQVVLDRTCFYPEGGGQPADKGWINGIPVTDVQKVDGQILHYLDKDPGTGTVSAGIDMEWRRDYMQQHTGQHIISGALWQSGKYKTVSVHMGSDITTIEVDREHISPEELEKVEDLANRIIHRNLPVEYIVTDLRELKKYELRKPCPVEGEIRLVRIEGFDCVGCGGIHLKTTGEVGLVKAVGIEKIRGQARISWKIGDRAMKDYRIKNDVIAELRTALQAREDMFPGKIREIQEELSRQRKTAGQLLSRLAVMMAEDLIENTNGSSDPEMRAVVACWKNEDNELIKRIMKELLKRKGIRICLVNTVGDTVYWNIGCSEDVPFDFDSHKPKLLEPVAGRGGGRHPLWQGTGTDPAGIEELTIRFRNLTQKEK